MMRVATSLALFGILGLPLAQTQMAMASMGGGTSGSSGSSVDDLDWTITDQRVLDFFDAQAQIHAQAFCLPFQPPVNTFGSYSHAHDSVYQLFWELTDVGAVQGVTGGGEPFTLVVDTIVTFDDWSGVNWPDPEVADYADESQPVVRFVDGRIEGTCGTAEVFGKMWSFYDDGTRYSVFVPIVDALVATAQATAGNAQQATAGGGLGDLNDLPQQQPPIQQPPIQQPLPNPAYQQCVDLAENDYQTCRSTAFNNFVTCLGDSVLGALGDGLLGCLVGFLKKSKGGAIALIKQVAAFCGIVAGISLIIRLGRCAVRLWGDLANCSTRRQGDLAACAIAHPQTIPPVQTTP